MDKFYTVPEVADLLQLSKSKMYRIVQRGEIPHVKIGRNVRILETDLEEWIEVMRSEQSTQLIFRIADLKRRV